MIVKICDNCETVIMPKINLNETGAFKRAANNETRVDRFPNETSLEECYDAKIGNCPDKVFVKIGVTPNNTITNLCETCAKDILFDYLVDTLDTDDIDTLFDKILNQEVLNSRRRVD